MRTAFKLITIITILYFAERQIQACTSFAVYSEQIWYGMNFDYPDTDIKFSIITYGSKKVFRTEFGTGGYIAGINEDGLFTNYQLLYYNSGDPTFEESNTLSIGDLNEYSINNLSSVSEVTSFIGDRFLVPSWGNNLHILFADTTGDALITEPFGTINGITSIQHNFLVMTNFPNYDFVGEDYTTVFGVGSERYISGYEYIQDHISGFSFDDGFETLSRTAQMTGDYPTQISLLFDPIGMEIFFCLNHDYSKIWKVSFGEETLETYSGFNTPKIHAFDASGIWSSELLQEITCIEDQDKLKSEIGNIKISPNPSSGHINIDLGQLPNRKSKVEIYNSIGKLVFMKVFQNINEASVDLTNQPNGIYLVSVLYNDKKITKYFSISK